MANRSNRRQFVWARYAGVLGPGVSVFATDVLSTVRDRYGDAVARGATVMAIRGYARPNAQGSGVPLRGRFALRVVGLGAIDDTPADQREVGPFLSPEENWMLFHQALVIGENPNPSASSSRGSQWAVETQANRRFEELGVTLGAFADVFNTDGTPSETGVYDFDLSIGLKLA